MNGKPAIQWWRPWTIEGKPSEEETTAEGASAEEGLSEVFTRVRARRVLALIPRWLKAGAREPEARQETGAGVAHGGPRSP